MAARAWDDDTATGVESMDAEHRLQVSLVNALEHLLGSQEDPALAHRTMAQLADFTKVHFLSEELMMRLYAYPHQDVHRTEHVRLVEQISKIERTLNAWEHARALQTIDELHGWLAAHIRTTDRAFARWCSNNDIVAR